MSSGTKRVSERICKLSMCVGVWAMVKYASAIASVITRPEDE